MAIKIVCDRCGKEVFEDAARHKYRKYNLGSYHFCGECMDSFKEWLLN